MPPADTETGRDYIKERESNEKGRRHKWGSGLRFRRRATPATASNYLPPRAGTEGRLESGVVRWVSEYGGLMSESVAARRPGFASPYAESERGSSDIRAGAA